MLSLPLPILSYHYVVLHICHYLFCCATWFILFTTTLAILNSCLIIIVFPRFLDLVTNLLTIEFLFVFIGRGVRQRICSPHELRRDWGYRKQPRINTTASWLPYSAVLRGRLLYHDPRLLGELGG